MIETASLPFWPLLAAALAFLLPWAVALLVGDAQHSGPRALAQATVLAVAAYAATGFALHFGGIGILIDHPDVDALVWEWTPLKQGDLTHWGVAGWMGFGLARAQTPLAAQLLLSTLPGVAAVILLIERSLAQHLAAWPRALVALLMAATLLPLAGNWTQAGGWLMHLGASLGAGEGFLDFGGASFFLLAGGTALAALLARNGPESALPHAASPTGVIALVAGGIGWLLASPLHWWDITSPAVCVLNSLLALAAGGFIGWLYNLSAAHTHTERWLARGAAAGWIASLAALPWLNAWQAMLTGAVAAWLYILTAWGLAALHRHDVSDIFAAFGVPAMWSLLAVGFFAPMPGQFKAQLIGLITLFLLSFFAVSLLLLLYQGISRLISTQPPSTT